MNRPNCVIEQKALAFPAFFPRFKADGTRNTINLASATLGADIQALLNATDPEERLYPMPRVENATFARTDTVFETAPSTRKYKIDGVGGVRTFNMELWGKDAVNAMLRELKKFGCSEIDMFYVDVAGSLWGIKDEINATTMRGYEVSAETFDAFKDYATDTTTNKIMVSFDLDNDECEENSYAITSDELGYKANSLKGLITGFLTLTSAVDGVVDMLAYSAYGSAGNRSDIVGLDTIAPPVVIGLVNEGPGQPGVMTNGAALTPVVGTDGAYTFTYIAGETDPGDVVTATITGATGFEMTASTFTSV
jgi:hypothetical protein